MAAPGTNPPLRSSTVAVIAPVAPPWARAAFGKIALKIASNETKMIVARVGASHDIDSSDEYANRLRW